MPTDSTLLTRLQQLSAFAGDPAAALRSLHAFFASSLPQCLLAVVLVRGLPPGQCRVVGLIGANGNEHLAVADPQDEQQRLPLFDDILSQRLLADTVAQRLRLEAAERASPLGQALLAPAALLALPIIDSGRINHWLVFGHPQPDFFDGLELDRMLLEANLAVSYIVRPLALRELSDEVAHSRHQIEGLADVQKLLLPQNIQIQGLDYAIHWQPADTAAGDYYDLVMLNGRIDGLAASSDADIWAAIIADVSGHGAASAMEAVQFDAILRTYQGDGIGPAGAITYANRYFFSRRQRQHFLTTLATLYRPDQRRLYYVSAGHPPLLHRRGGTVALHGEGAAIPLGILRDHVWENCELALQRDDVVVLYTDGIVEARDAGGVPFGMPRLQALLAEADANADAQQLLQRLRDAVFAHQGSSVGSDDQTLIVLRITH